MATTGQGPRYREIRRLGAGGMATVTLAEDTVLGRPVALKKVHSYGDSRGILRLKREALVGASLSHPNLVSVFDAQAQPDGDLVIVMEYVRGGTLADLIRARGALAPEEALRVLSGVAAGLDAIHQRGIVHRDVKPANVLLGSDGAVKLADLGIAGVADRTRITRSDEVVGSFNYMAPEQLEGGNAGPAIDVYGLAAVAYETLSGERAHPETNPLALANAITNQPPPDLTDAWPDAPRGAAEVLIEGMAVDPGARPGSAGELIDRLRTSLNGGRNGGTPAAVAATATRPVSPARRAAAPAGRPVRRPALAREPAASPPAGRRGAIVPALLAVAALAIAGVVYAAASATNGGSPARSRSAATNKTAGRTHRHRATRSAAAGQTTTAAGGAGSSAGAAGSSAGAAGSSTGAPSSSTASTPPATVGTAPARAVESFYEDAANHQYAAAWALADSSMRNQLGGYSAFQNQMSSVRSITFHRAQVAPGASTSAATVTVATTSVQTTRTQQCTGTVRTVRSGSSWLLDAIAINCS